MKNLTIKTKITIWYVIFLLIITGVFFTIIIHTGNLRAGDIARTRLTEAVLDARDQIGSKGADFIIDDDLEFYESGVYMSVYDENGELIEGRRPVELIELPNLQDEKMTKIKEDGEVWYVYDSMFHLEDKNVWVRGVTEDFAENGTFSYVMRFALIAFPALVAIAAAGGYVITKRGFKPVREILETVDEIGKSGDLSRRIYLESSGKIRKDEISNLAQAFNGMFDSLEASFEKEKRFTSDVSHELRTPLAVIISQSEYALEEEEYREKSLGVINREAKRMAGLVNRLLMLSRSDAGQLELHSERVDLSEMCEAIVLQQEDIASQKNIKIHADIQENVEVNGDEAMLIRIALNLIDNAIKYGKKGGNVRLRLSICEDNACLEIEDDGIGIAKENMDKIWERFYRADESRSEDGSGLGLSMVKALVKAHGGSIRAESEIGKGSVFTVELPLYREFVNEKITGKEVLNEEVFNKEVKKMEGQDDK